MSIDLPDHAYELLKDLAQRLIPAGDGMPSAAAAVSRADIGRVLVERPDLVEPIRDGLRRVAEKDPERRLGVLREEAPAELEAIAETIAGAYFLAPAVSELLGYRRRRAIPIVPDADLGELTQAVVARGWDLPGAERSPQIDRNASERSER